MNPELVLAISLLLSPPQTPVEIPTAEQWPALRDSLVATAVEWQILDPRESRYTFTVAADLASDLDRVRSRRVDLVDAPRVEDASRLPSREHANELIRFNRCYLESLEVRAALELDRVESIRVVIAEVNECYRAWDLIRDAKCEFYYVTVRRQAMKRLRDMIGPDAYSAGHLPPHVPLWRFEELK